MSRLPADSGRGKSAVSGVVVGAAVSVAVNVWTSGWEWPAGAGLIVLVAVQGWLEFRRAARQRAERAGSGVSVDQRARETVNSDITGLHGAGRETEVTVRQRLGLVQDSHITGVKGTKDV